MTAVRTTVRAGLSTSEAAARHAADGPNVLPVQARVPAWRQLLAELVHFFAILLWVAGGLAFIARMPQLGVAIFVVVVLNAVFAFVQQRRAEHAAEKLRALLPARVTVVRDGRPQTIDAEDLVVGDLVQLTEGDRVSADLELTAVRALAIDTSALTGESVPTRPEPGASAYAGCFVVEGEAEAVVTDIGQNTRLADIARLSQAQRAAHTPMRQELERISRILAAVAIGVGVAFFGIAVLVGIQLSGSFLFAVGVTVAIIPEGLLPTVTLSLAMGAQRMAHRHALVRNLEAVETLGSTTYICTDKTGTLTQNMMSVVEVWLPGGPSAAGGIARITGNGYEPEATVDCPAALLPDLARTARAGVLSSTGRIVQRDQNWSARGDPMEAALDALAHRVGVASGLPRLLAKFPFDARRRRMSVVVAGDAPDHVEVLVKGAPDAVLPLCPPTPGVDEALRTMMARGWRLLAIAAADATSVPTDPATAERGLVLLGLVALEDPPRPEAREALEACRRAGVRVAMITGDHPGTAEAIARELGLIDPAADRAPLIVTGAELPSDPEQLGALLDRDGTVVARVEPEDKLRIAKALTGRGHVVAMTGDGVNDAPALRTAAIGVAMGKSGTDVARQAADLVLLDDNFGTIVAAIEQGRATYTNIRRFLTYHLSDNVAELVPFVVWALSGGRFPLAIGVLQVLALDIGTDILPALALGAEPPSQNVLDRQPTKRHLMDRALFGRAFGLLGPAESAASLAAFICTFFAAGWRPGEPFPGGPVLLSASGAAFTAVVLGQMANAYACRSTSRPFWSIRPGTNQMLLWALGAELLLLAVFLYVPPAAALLGQTGPGLVGLLVALLSPLAVLAADSSEKLLAGPATPGTAD